MWYLLPSKCLLYKNKLRDSTVANIDKFNNVTSTPGFVQPFSFMSDEEFSMCGSTVKMVYWTYRMEICLNRNIGVCSLYQTSLFDHAIIFDRKICKLQEMKIMNRSSLNKMKGQYINWVHASPWWLAGKIKRV